MDRIIDEAIQKLLSMSLDEFSKYKPLTVGEKIALTLLKESISDDSVIALRAIQMVADRTAGRAVQSKPIGQKNELAEKLTKLGGNN